MKHPIIQEIENRLKDSQKMNYHEVMYKIIEFESINKKPRILLHACCAVCASLALELLGEIVELTIYFYNPNIHPKIEYIRRMNALTNLVENYNNEYKLNIKCIVGEYDPINFFKITKGLEFEKEGHERCKLCYEFRFDNVAKYAKDNNYDMFSSAITISPLKNSEVINEVGFKSAKKNNIMYLPTDFKKQQGNLKAKKICDKFNVYRQNYCGCIYGARDQNIQIRNIIKEARLNK